jgi:ribosomal protein S18 acetylase RimI-like enzyme
VEIRASAAVDADGCVAVLAALPDWFTPSTHAEVRAHLEDGPGWVATDAAGIVGFVTATRRFPGAAEITYAGVLADRHRRGVGTALVERAVADLAAAGVRVVEVKTLDASAGYEPYVATRAFWAARGFVQIDVIDPLPGWDPGNPSAILARPT